MDYDANLPIIALFEQIDSTLHYVTAKVVPCTAKQITTIAFQMNVVLPNHKKDANITNKMGDTTSTYRT